MAKRIFDFIVSFIGLVLLSPVLLITALFIKADSQGPILYRAKRVGRDGKVFTMYKFRSMVINADKIGGPSTPIDDPRLTRVGKTLKRFQLDELPQLINVLKGDMSLVGPRPEVSSEIDSLDLRTKTIILSVKPGVTSLATLANPHEGEVLKGSEDPHKTYCEKIKPEKMRLNLEYVKNRSFWLDIKIIVKTFFVAVFR